MIPQPITVHGRSGTVVYLDNNWLPVPAARATMAKVVFDDGGVAFYTTPEPSKPEGLGGITRKFDAALHPRGEDGRFIEASQPRIFNRPSEIAEIKGWPGEPVRFGWKDPQTGETTGRLLTGEPIPREKLPETLYHVTTNAPAVESSGVLLGLLESGGLGGGQALGVSFTSDPMDAVVIQRELRRAVQIARGEITLDDLTRFAREDEKEAGLPEGALNDALGFGKQQYEGNEFTLHKMFVWDKDLPDDKRGWQNTPPPPEEQERLRRSLMKDAFNAYLQLRGHSDIATLKNPILFGRQEQLAKLTPENVRTLTIPSAQIPEGALVTTGSDKFLHEVRAYSDVPLWKKLQSVAKKEFDESKHPRVPGGSGDSSGEFTATGRVGEATPDPVLAEQAKVGIVAVEKLLPEAIKTADYDEAPAPKTWEDVDSDVQDNVRATWEQEQYENGVEIDTRGLDDEIRREVGQDNQAILDKAVEDTIETLNHAKPFKDPDPTLPLTLSLHKTLDPDTIDYGPGDHEEAGWHPSGRKDHGGTVELDLAALRFTSGEELTPEQQKIVKEHWDAAYNEQYLQAVEKAFESDNYTERRNELESDQVSAEWNNLLDRDKYDFMIERKLLTHNYKEGEPVSWTTGVGEGTHNDENYARTHAVALRLTEMRTDELREERGLLTQPGERPKYLIVDRSIPAAPDLGHPGTKNFVILDAKTGKSVGASNTEEHAKLNAEEWAKTESERAMAIDTHVLIQNVWDSWKAKSSEGLGLSLQLAAARELNGFHRMSPDEVAAAEDEASVYGGIPTLQAYVRAQWEVTQMVMKKAGEPKVDVYRALMLPGDQVRTTVHERLDKTGKPIPPPTNVTVLHRKEPGREKDQYVTFDYAGEHFVIEKEVVMVRPSTKEKPPESITDIDPDEGFVAEIETTEAAVERRITAYHQSSQGKSILVKLPALQLQRAGAQSTTGTVAVANDWGGVGNLPDNPERVVIRIEAPATSILSLPVYGKNIQEEHESVLVGTKDKWLWDAWWNKAPSHKVQSIALKADMKRLIIDLQAEDRGKPHWMSSVNWDTVQSVAKFDPNQPRHPKGSEQGGEFAKTRQGARKAIMDVIEGPVGVDDHPVAIRAAHDVAVKLQEMKQRGYPMPHQVVVEAQQGRKAPGGEAWENGTIFLRVPDNLPPEMSMDEAMAIRSKPVEGDINPFTGKPHPPGLPKFVSQKFEDVVVHEMGHILRRPSIAAPYITNRSSPEDLAKSEASREQFAKEMAANKGFEAAANTVSQYAHSNPDEFVAEVFTVLYNGGTLPPATLAVYDGFRGATVR